jgi:anti-sigma B factor antagonist
VAGELEVEAKDLGGVFLLRPRGFINAHTVRQFESALHGAMEDRRYKIVIDCAELVYIASAGLGAVMGAIEEVRTHGGDIRWSQLNETVQNIFEILGFDLLYRTFPSPDDAVTSFDAVAGEPS